MMMQKKKMKKKNMTAAIEMAAVMNVTPETVAVGGVTATIN